MQLKNTNHLVANNIYVAGVLVGHRSQFAIAAGSGTSVATDIMCNWNDGKPDQGNPTTFTTDPILKYGLGDPISFNDLYRFV